jgi:hypothetical protein
MPARLTLLPYLREWDGSRLALRLLVAPRDRPLDPLLGAGPTFAAATFTFEVRLVQGLAALPTTGTPYQPETVTVPTPPDATTLCQGLEAALGIDPTVTPVDPRTGSAQFLKYAPPRYRELTGYASGRNPYLLTDDRYHCALKTPPPAGTRVTSDPPKIGWGKALATALRQPLLAEAIGLVRPLLVSPPAGFFDEGGWVYVTLAANSEASGLIALPDGLRSYAARVPALSTPRALFTSVLFPVAAIVPPASYDGLFREVVSYDDGFAKVAYAQQPARLDPLSEEDDGTRPANDLGIQLGWDDEQVATWLNRQIDPAAAVQDAPMGVLGYRVDARLAGDPAWHSLVMGRTSLTLGGVDLGVHTGEFRVEVAPNRLMGDPTGPFWIPVYYTTWTGPSLAGPDPTVAALHGLTTTPVVAGVDPDVLLRYGRHYEFRVRLVDHTGGGPDLGEAPSNPAPAPLAPLHFLRWVRPTAVRLDAPPPTVPDPANPPSSLTVRRPLLAYPACVYAGGSRTDVLADIPAAQAEKRGPGLPDLDAGTVEIEVQVEFPGEDSGFLTLYTTTRPFPATATDPVTLDLDWRDIADARTLSAGTTGALPVPTARLVQIVLRPLVDDRADYYGDADVRRGPDLVVALRKESSDERSLLTVRVADPVEGIFLQPESAVESVVAAAQVSAGKALAAPDNPLGRLATALGLDQYELGLRARPGQRLLFGAAPALRHVIGPDGASVRFAAMGDLTRLWLVSVRLDLSRDWSWDALAYLSISRDGVEVGRVEPRRTVGHEALSSTSKDLSTVVFLDALDPKPAAGVFPAEIHLAYRVTPVFRTAPGQSDPPLDFALHLPITTTPAQVPRLASAGLAFSPYRRDSGYTQVEVRQRALWLEFEEPVADPADRYFARVLAYAPDPVITRENPDLSDVEEPPLPVDPEPIRTVVPGQSDDEAGLGAMQELLPTDSPRHFLVPLPPGLTVESLELFGFFTYELRVGHRIGWTTAQGRYGRPLRVTGVQHPVPVLACSVVRNRLGLQISAPYADPVLDGQSLLPAVPVTQLWVLLYAQVRQADDADARNVLLGHRPAVTTRKRWADDRLRQRAGSVDHATATWSSREIDDILRLLALGPDTPLSCVVVETLPADVPVSDPVGAGLGYERFLRTSPLTAVPELC